MPTLTCTILAGNSLSGPVDCSSIGAINFLGMPSDWNGGQVTFQYSPDGGTTFFDLYDFSGREISLDMHLGSMVPPPGGLTIIGSTFLKFRSGHREWPIVQNADRIFTIVGPPTPP
jgi:hypothetical protein